jgi:hypothetical protein
MLVSLQSKFRVLGVKVVRLRELTCSVIKVCIEVIKELPIIIKNNTHPSSFCKRLTGFAMAPPTFGEGLGGETATPPPPRSGFAMRPKVRGEDAAF